MYSVVNSQRRIKERMLHRSNQRTLGPLTTPKPSLAPPHLPPTHHHHQHQSIGRITPAQHQWAKRGCIEVNRPCSTHEDDQDCVWLTISLAVISCKNRSTTTPLDTKYSAGPPLSKKIRKNKIKGRNSLQSTCVQPPWLSKGSYFNNASFPPDYAQSHTHTTRLNKGLFLDFSAGVAN